MNVQEIVPNTNGTLLHYVVTALSFTLLSVWVITAFRSRYRFRRVVPFWQRLGWPVFFVLRMFGKDPYAPDPPQQDIDLLLLDQGLLREHHQRYVFIHSFSLYCL